MIKKIGNRLLELTLFARGSQYSGSRNLLTISVQYFFKWPNFFTGLPAYSDTGWSDAMATVTVFWISLYWKSSDRVTLA